MGMTSKEKAKRYRERLKLNPEKMAERKRKKRESYHKNKKLLADLKAQDKVNCRVIWKLRKQEQRKRKKAIQHIIAETPPSSPSILVQEPIDHPFLASAPPNSPAPAASPVSSYSANNTRGRKKVRRDRTKIYRENMRLKQANEELHKKYEKYKKRAQRYKIKSQNIHKESMEKTKCTEEEQNKYTILSNAIKNRYKKIHNNKEKKFLKNIFQDMKTSEKKNIIKDSLGIEGNIRISARPHRFDTDLKKKISEFFKRDDISRNTAGKNDTIGRGIKKMQKRFLIDSMKNLYKSFKLENPDVKCSYFYFTKHRPYYVVKPTVDGREMCLCKIHTNATYKAKALRNKNVLQTCDLSSLIMQTVCDDKNKDCMLGACKECKDIKIKLNSNKIHGNIQWFEWIREEQIYTKEGKETKAVKNVKRLKEDTIENLILSFEEHLKVLKKHVFNLKNQYRSFRQSIDNIQQNEAVILVDFSENYNAKCTEEIQGHHFGGSREQVTLHTVVVYVKSENSHTALSFCTVSACNIHQPAAIWAHLQPILNNILANYPEVSIIHFFSDGPFSQYRQKANFFLSCTKIFDYGFKAFTWSYFETGHGKGPADGIGGYLKRAADNLVATLPVATRLSNAMILTNASEFYHALEGSSKVKLFLVCKEQIETIQNQIPKNIVPLVGTLQVHQVFSKLPGQLKYRNLSCFCARGFCECLDPKVYHPTPALKKTATVQKTGDCDIIYSSDDDLPLSRLPTSSNEEDIYLKDLLKNVSENIYKSVYDSSETSDNDMDEEKKSSTEYNNYNETLFNNLPRCELSGSADDKNKQLFTSEQNKSPGFDLPGPTLSGTGDYEDKQPSKSGKKKYLPGPALPRSTLPEPGDDEDQQPSTSGQKNNLPGRGDYLLVKVYGAKGKSYTYVCVAQSDIEDDGEIKVTFLKAVKRGKLFILDQKDVSYVAYEDIIKKLPNPDAEYKRGEVYYKFSCNVDVFEK